MKADFLVVTIRDQRSKRMCASKEEESRTLEEILGESAKPPLRTRLVYWTITLVSWVVSSLLIWNFIFRPYRLDNCRVDNTATGELGTPQDPCLSLYYHHWWYVGPTANRYDLSMAAFTGLVTAMVVLGLVLFCRFVIQRIRRPRPGQAEVEPEREEWVGKHSRESGGLSRK